MPHLFQSIRKNSKHKKTDSDSDENQKMKRIEFLSFRDIESDDGNNKTWDYKKRLKKIHETGD